MSFAADWNAVQSRIATVPRSASEYTTNFYAPAEQVERWCVRGRVSVLDRDGAVLILRSDRDFHHVYHVAENLEALTQALADLAPGTYTVDLVGQGEALDRVCAAYRAAGFTDHAFLVRMNRVEMAEQPTPEETALAHVDDAPSVAALLDRLLDPYTEQLPDIDELRDAARDARLLLARDGSEIAGMLLYEMRGRLAHLRFWHVAPEARGAGVGRRLMGTFLARCSQARRIVLWVIGDNDRSIAIYRHYGFAADGLLDRVMILHKDQQ